MSYLIKEVKILDQNSTELECYYPNDRTENIEQYRANVYKEHYPELRKLIPDLSISCLSVLLCHKKFS